MKIYIADYAGFCFGVKRAIEIAENTLSQLNENEQIYSLGPLVHNPQVVEKFNRKGLKVINNTDEINNGKIIIRSHGISGNLQKRLESKNLELIDGTCPYVKAVHNKVKNYHEKGYKIVIIGDKNHPEVIGINGWCNDEAIIINSEEEANNIPDYDKICVVSQTTNTQEKFQKLSDIVAKKGKEVKVFNTICNATNQRQSACEELAKKVDAMIVIGGYHSSNTNKLAEISRKYCKNVYHIETHDELPLDEISKFNTVGITAGASTPDWIIEEVIKTLENLNNNKMLEEIERTMKKIKRGDIVKGKIISISQDQIVVNINYKSDGIIPKEEISNDPTFDHTSMLKEGQEIEVYILKLDYGEGNVILSRKKAETIRGWNQLERDFKNNKVIECKVVEILENGLKVVVKGITGFIPKNQISVNYINNLSKYRNKTLKVKIIDLNPRKNRIILSSKEIEKERLIQKREQLWNSLKIGQLVEGQVKKIVDFGAFVDIGELDGLIHISELSWERINHPSDVVNVGDRIKAVIIDLDKEKNKVSLSLKETLPKPWDKFIKNKKIGDIVTGRVTKILNFGALVKLEEGVDGLIHVSEISLDRVKNPSDKLKIGDIVQVKILNIDEKRQKISLSLKAIEEEKIKLAEEKIMKEYKNQELDVTIGDLMKKKIR